MILMPVNLGLRHMGRQSTWLGGNDERGHSEEAIEIARIYHVGAMRARAPSEVLPVSTGHRL
jgi:hypothetical protein